MRLLKILITFAVGFAMAWIVVLTFGQTEFRQAVPANLFFYKTRAVPIYYYLASTFALGLLIGLALALVNYLSQTSKIWGLKKQVKQHEETIRVLDGRLRETKTPAPAAPSGDDSRYTPKPAGDAPAGQNTVQ